MPARTLSKSDFKLARTCEAKLFFRENGYPDNRSHDPYLALLAEGGYMVEALAKTRYPDGIQLQYGGSLAEEFAATAELLRRDRVTLFEATLASGRMQARVDALEKKGNVVRLIEMKAKSFDGAAHRADLIDGGGGIFRTGKKRPRVVADWREKLEDITYQVLLLEKAFPGLEVRPYLALVDKSKRARIDGIPRLFELVLRAARDGSTRLHTARYIGTAEQVELLDLVTEVDVSAEVDLLRGEVAEAAARLESRLDASLGVFLRGLERTSECKKCEYRTEGSPERSGFRDCWGSLADPSPHLLELYAVGKAKTPDRQPLVQAMFNAGTTSLFDIPIDGLVMADGTIGPEAERQRRQIELTLENRIYVRGALRPMIEALRGPLHFIDFEASRLALPYHRGMRPYGLVTFQWSVHTVAEPGAAPTHAEWLNDVDLWPNQSFAESLRAAIGDTGPVLTWSHFEASVMKEIIADLEEFGAHAPELAAWVEDLRKNRIVDLHDWARAHFYHPGMRGRTSIKVVLDALWQDDSIMRRQLAEWTGLAATEQDPYAALPPIEINGELQDVREGTGAVRAYQEMMYGASKDDPTARRQWADLLRQYCALDTLSMVLIFEYWRRAVARPAR